MSNKPKTSRDRATSQAKRSALDILADARPPMSAVDEQASLPKKQPNTMKKQRRRVSAGKRMTIIVSGVLVVGGIGMARLGATDSSCARFNTTLEPSAGTPAILVFGIDQVTNSQTFADEVANQVAADLRRVSVDSTLPLILRLEFTADGNPRDPANVCLAEPLVLLPGRGDLTSYNKGSESSRAEMQGRMDRTRADLIDEVAAVVADELRRTTFAAEDPAFSPRELWDAIATTVGDATEASGPVHVAVTSTWLSNMSDCLDGESSATPAVLVRDCVSSGALPKVTAETVDLHYVHTLATTASQRFDATAVIDAFCTEATATGCVARPQPSPPTPPTPTDHP